jgi:hypothetical protein|tara:strand:- start:7 stop:240 length:234 start_codon:yes stop_codon:yes gene_type:complete
MINLYLIFTILFLAIHALSLEKNILSLIDCRSREMRVHIRKNIRRDLKDVLFSLVWPFLIFRAARTIFLNRKELSRN